jgi:hypothetical protein
MMWGRMSSGAAVADGRLSRLSVGSQVAYGQPALQCLTVCLAALVLSACSAPPVSRSLTEAIVCLPSDTQAVAGVYLERIRGKEFYNRLPPAWSFVLEPFRSANLVLLAYSGSDILVIASGRFASAPPGTVLLNQELALAGSPGAIRAATTQYATGRPGVPDLVAQAAPVMNRDLWAISRGSTRLPLPGNAANLNRLLALTDYTAASATLDSAIHLEAEGHSGSAESASRLEEQLRALITLAKSAAKRTELAPVLASAELRREGSIVHLRLVASPQAVQQLLGF